MWLQGFMQEIKMTAGSPLFVRFLSRVGIHWVLHDHVLQTESVL